MIVVRNVFRIVPGKMKEAKAVAMEGARSFRPSAFPSHGFSPT